MDAYVHACMQGCMDKQVGKGNKKSSSNSRLELDRLKYCDIDMMINQAIVIK